MSSVLKKKNCILILVEAYKIHIFHYIRDQILLKYMLKYLCTVSDFNMKRNSNKNLNSKMHVSLFPTPPQLWNLKLWDAYIKDNSVFTVQDLQSHRVRELWKCTY